MNIIQRVRDTLAYRKAMREYAKDHVVCECCGSPKMMMRIRLEVHHILPVSVAPECAANYGNMIALCASCHYVVGHNRNWQTYNSNLIGSINGMRYALLTTQLEVHHDRN